MPQRTAASAARKPTFVPTPLTASARRALGPQDAELVTSVMSEAMDFMPAPEFARSNAERKIFTDAPSIRRPKVDWYCPLMHEERASGRGNDSLLLTGAQILDALPIQRVAARGRRVARGDPFSGAHHRALAPRPLR